ncbi:MAG: hypothetical protein IPL84_14215 [Chitinophagaceae bacterium]|nr:hypothetical protein [Chitinophagaceae bacterium]
MKRIITLLFVTGVSTVWAQPRLLTSATINTKTTIVAPETDEEAPAGNFTNENGEQVVIRHFGGDGETKTTTWLKNDLQKTFSESDMGRTTVIRDHSKKMTTTIMEMMGRKSGFYATDDDQEQMRKRMDSMMQGRDQSASFGNANSSPPVYTISYTEENKKVSGYACKKALIIATRFNGKADTTNVWYCPDFKIQNLPNTGGVAAGFGGFNAVGGPSGFEDLAGFPMEYERNLSRGRKMTVQVTKIVTDKEIPDKEFDISKDIEIKAMKDMQNEGGPGIRIRMGG